MVRHGSGAAPAIPKGPPPGRPSDSPSPALSPLGEKSNSGLHPRIRLSLQLASSCKVTTTRAKPMEQDLIFLPMGCLALWTFAVLLIIPYRRFAAARRGLVKAADFKYGESVAVPGEVSIPNRNYMNLLEVPVLFYV